MPIKLWNNTYIFSSFIHKTISPVNFLVQNFLQIIIPHHLLILLFFANYSYYLIIGIEPFKPINKTTIIQKFRLQIEDRDKFANKMN